jgi:MFS family permease
LSGWLPGEWRQSPRSSTSFFTTAIALFTLASAGCAAAVDLPMLTATRALQGVGGAMMMVPVGRLMVLRTTPKTDLVRAIAYLTGLRSSHP